MCSKALWLHSSPPFAKGVLVGCDAEQEWILPWWWERYSTLNSLPVAFVDFGMSLEMRAWCAERGTVFSLSLEKPVAKNREEIDPDIVRTWEIAYGIDFWNSRGSWFKKPFALLQTPFARTLWLDIDCEVKSDLSPLFEEMTSDLALVRESFYAHDHMRAFSICMPDEVVYNSGVVLFAHGSPMIALWADQAVEGNIPFWTDQHLLARLIHEKKYPIKELSPLYNWFMALGKNPEARIIHWLGERGKMYIKMNGLGLA